MRKKQAEKTEMERKPANGAPGVDTTKFHEQAIKQMYEQKLDGDQVRAIVRKLVDRLDAYYAEAAFEFETKLAGSCGQWSDGPVMRDFVKMLQPEIETLEDKLLTVLEKARVSDDPKLFDVDADFMHFKSMVEQAAYAIGVIAGARMAGMSSEKVKDLAGYLDGWL